MKAVKYFAVPALAVLLAAGVGLAERGDGDRGFRGDDMRFRGEGRGDYRVMKTDWDDYGWRGFGFGGYGYPFYGGYGYYGHPFFGHYDFD